MLFSACFVFCLYTPLHNYHGANYKNHVTNYQYHMANYQYQVTNYQYQVTNYQYQVTNYQYHVTNYQYHIANYHAVLHELKKYLAVVFIHYIKERKRMRFI